MAFLTTEARGAAACDVILADVNNNPTPGYIEIYDGTPPASLGDPADGNTLSTCTLVDGTVDAFAATATTAPLTAVGYTSGGIFALDSSIAMSGTATYFRLLDSAGNPVLQGTVGTSGADLILDSVTLVLAGTVTITQFDVTYTGAA